MPTYVFICDKCKYKFEREMSMNEYRIPSCPKCDGGCFQKFLPPNTIFRGHWPGKEIMRRRELDSNYERKMAEKRRINAGEDGRDI